MTQRPVLDLPREQDIRDELQQLVLADLHGPLGGDDEEFSGENPIDRDPLGAWRPGAWCWSPIPTTTRPPTQRELAGVSVSGERPEPAQPRPARTILDLPGAAVRDRSRRPSSVLPRHDRPNGGDPDDVAEQQRLAMPTGSNPEFASGSGAAVHAVIDEHIPLRAKQIHIRTVPDYEIPATAVVREQAIPCLIQRLPATTVADLTPLGATAAPFDLSSHHV
ncbi:MAG: hypothetical protein ACRDST_23770 [Pseudonocardiaceae bacterium]